MGSILLNVGAILTDYQHKRAWLVNRPQVKKAQEVKAKSLEHWRPLWPLFTREPKKKSRRSDQQYEGENGFSFLAER